MIRASAGSCDITPIATCELAGYSSRKGCYDGVADRLEINCLVLEDGSSPIVLVTADLLYGGDALKEAIWIESGANRVVRKEAFLFGASHTHFAPSVDETKPYLGRVDEAYVDFVIARASGLLKKLLGGRKQPVTIEYSMGTCDHSVNRHKMGWTLDRSGTFGLRRAPMMAPDFRGKTDETLHALKLKSEDGAVMAVLWNYACHPAVFPEKNLVSADFPGLCRRILRRELDGGGPPLPVLFYQGFSGNIRPKLVSRMCVQSASGLKSRVKQLINGPCFGTPSVGEYAFWAASLAGVLLDALNRPAEALREIKLLAGVKQIALCELFDDESPGDLLTLQKIVINERLSLAAISAEVAVEYSEYINELSRPSIVIPIGCIDWVFGYLLTKRLMREGAYGSKGYTIGQTRAFNEDLLLGELQFFRNSPGA